jgi:hypothetical protein
MCVHSLWQRACLLLEREEAVRAFASAKTSAQRGADAAAAAVAADVDADSEDGSGDSGGDNDSLKSDDDDGEGMSPTLQLYFPHLHHLHRIVKTPVDAARIQ